MVNQPFKKGIMYDYQKDELAHRIATFVTVNNTLKYTELKNSVKNIIEEYLKDEMEVGGWTVEDVKAQACDEGYKISDDEARSVLDTLEHQYDANIGINWDVISDELHSGHMKNGKEIPNYILTKIE